MKTTIKDLGSLDLTKYSPEALRKIKKIKTVGNVRIASDADKEYYDAFSEIIIKDVGSIRQIPANGDLIEINGFGELDKVNATENTIVVVNGFATARKFDLPHKMKLYVNGFIIYEKDAPIEIVELNGFGIMIEESLNDCKFYSNKLVADRDFIANIGENKTVVVGNELQISSDVTLEMLRLKNPKFIVGNKIICNCSKEATGWIKANSRYGNELVV